MVLGFVWLNFVCFTHSWTQLITSFLLEAILISFASKFLKNLMSIKNNVLILRLSFHFLFCQSFEVIFNILFFSIQDLYLCSSSRKFYNNVWEALLDLSASWPWRCRNPAHLNYGNSCPDIWIDRKTTKVIKHIEQSQSELPFWASFQRSDDEYDTTFDLSLENTSADLKLRPLEDRMNLIIKYISGEMKLNIKKAEFVAIPTRIISAHNF